LPKQIRSCFGRILDAETIEKLDENKLELHKLYCLLALGFAEDLPMTFLSGYYLVRATGLGDVIRIASHFGRLFAQVKSVDECIIGPSQLCDLTAGTPNIVNVLSVITSAAMLMYKVRAFSDLLHCAQTRIGCVLAQ
jgi:hypothetical protein